MAGKILLEVVTPEKLLLSQDVDMVIAPGSEGEFGVLPGHCHFLSTLRIGELRYQTGDIWHYMSVLWGFAEVTPTKVTVMAEVAEKAEDIDVGRAQQAVEKAEAAPPGRWTSFRSERSPNQSRKGPSSQEDRRPCPSHSLNAISHPGVNPRYSADRLPLHVILQSATLR